MKHATSWLLAGPYLGFFVCGGKLGFREISDQYSYKKQPSKIRHYVRKKTFSFPGGGNCPLRPPLCTALVSGHKSESSIRSYCKTDTITKKQMSESMAAATSIVALPESNVPPSPILSLPQEEFLTRDVSVSTSTTQVSKSYNFSNCNVIFNN